MGAEGSDSSATAKAALAQYLAQIQVGDWVDFEEFCAERPELADELRILHTSWASLRVEPTRPQSEIQSLREFISMQHGSVDVDLDDEAPKSHGSGVQERLVRLATQTGRYDLRGEVARGGMGVILKVWDKDLRRTLAMKASFDNVKGIESDPSLAPPSVARFLEEAQITSQLDHPGIVPVHELGVDDDGRMYFTMQLVKGMTLDKLIKLAREDEEGWNRPRAVGVMVKICEAMAYAHAKGVIHRDLKPANIMAGKFGEVYVMDWGLAKVIGHKDRPGRSLETLEEDYEYHTRVRTDRLEDLQRTPDSPLLTMDGTILGTPTYMPPEQAKGEIDALDPRSDVYSVGSLLYTLLTGRMPYVDPKDPPTSGQVLMMLVAGPPTPVMKIDPSVPPELVAICEKAMARKPDERYSSMVEMAEDLRAFVENRVVRAHKTGAVAEFTKWVSRNKLTAAVAILLLAFLLGGSVFFAWQQRERYQEVQAAHALTKQASKRAVANERRAVKNAETARVNAERAERQSYLANLAAAHASLRMYETADAKSLLQACPERYRGWEWRYLRRATDTSIHVLRGHEAKVTAVAFSRDQKRIASGSADKSVRIWDAETLRMLFKLPELDDPVAALVFSPDGRFIAGTSRDTLVRLWNADTGRLMGTFPHDSDVTALAFSRDSARLVTGTDEAIHLWEVKGFKPLAKLGDAGVEAVAFSRDSKRVVAGDFDGVHVWDLATRKKTATYPLEEGAVCLAVSDTHIAAGSGRNIRYIDMEDGAATEFVGHLGAVRSLRFDKARLVSGSSDRTVRVWDVETGVSRSVLQGHDDRVLSVDIAGGVIVSGSEDRTVRLWKAVGGGSVLLLPGDEDFLSGVAFDPNGGRVAAASAGHGEIRFFDVSSGRQVAEIEQQGGALSSLVFSPDGRWIIAGCHGDATAHVHDARTGERKQTLRGHELSVTSVAVSRDGQLVATGSDDRTVLIHRLADGGRVASLGGHGGEVHGVAFGEGRRIATACADGKVRIWDRLEGKPRVLDAHTGAVLALAFSPDGALLASAGADQTIRFFNPGTGSAGHVLTGHGAPVRALAFHPDGTRLASASVDKTVRIWDVEQGASLLRLLAHGAWVNAVAFSPDGALLGTASYDTTAKVWRTR